MMEEKAYGEPMLICLFLSTYLYKHKQLYIHVVFLKGRDILKWSSSRVNLRPFWNSSRLIEVLFSGNRGIHLQLKIKNVA